MKALYFNQDLCLKEVPKPLRKRGEILIRVSYAGICNTDHELLRGYLPGFSSILGHEFIGIVEDADDPSFIGKRCTAEINCACHSCEYCARGLERHCAGRSVIGIVNRDGAMAEYIAVPQENCIPIPPDIPDQRAVFIEPLAAALEILDQVSIQKKDTVLVLGDGKLGLLVATVLASTGCALTVVGRHGKKLRHLDYLPVRAVVSSDFKGGSFDYVVEAAGNPDALTAAMNFVKPRGTIILKSTYAGGFFFNPSSLVVNEVTLLGSRCGRFSAAVDFLEKHRPPLENLISRIFPLEQFQEAFACSSRKDTLKVVLSIA